MRLSTGNYHFVATLSLDKYICYKSEGHVQLQFVATVRRNNLNIFCSLQQQAFQRIF